MIDSYPAGHYRQHMAEGICGPGAASRGVYLNDGSLLFPSEAKHYIEIFKTFEIL